MLLYETVQDEYKIIFYFIYLFFFGKYMFFGKGILSYTTGTMLYVNTFFFLKSGVSSLLVSSLGGLGRHAKSGYVLSSRLISGPQYPRDLWGLLDEEEEVPA